MTTPDLFTPPERLPFVRRSQTSIKAARNVKAPIVNRDKELILNYLREHGKATDDEMILKLCPPIHINAFRARRGSLVKEGKILMMFERGITSSGNQANLWKIRE